jgi:hypothetical protein
MDSWTQIDVTDKFFLPIGWLHYLIQNDLITFDMKKFARSMQGEAYSLILGSDNKARLLDHDLVVMARKEDGKLSTQYYDGNLELLNYDGRGGSIKLISFRNVEDIPYKYDAVHRRVISKLMKFDKVSISGLREYSLSEILED